MLPKPRIKPERLFLCFVITFILVDICPYPNWPPGFIQSAITHIHKNIVSSNYNQNY